jgi:flagellar export protein FliJ
MPSLPPYRLQALVEIRERKKEEAEAYLGTCIKALTVEEEKLQGMETELTRMVNKRLTLRQEYMDRAMRGEVSAQKAIDTNTFIKRMMEMEKEQQEAIEGQKEVIVARKEDVDEARRKLVTATQDLKALEKHKEQWMAAIVAERARKEEETLDELAQTIFLRGGS